MSRITINTSSASDRINLLNLLIQFDYKWHGGERRCETGEGIETLYSFKSFPTVTLNVPNKEIAGCRLDSSTFSYPQDSAKIIELLTNKKEPKKPIPLGDVAGYRTEVDETSVKIGCQTIPHEKILEIHKTIKDLQ